MVMPGSGHPREVVAEGQASLREGLNDPAQVTRAEADFQAGGHRKERWGRRRRRWAAALKRAFKRGG